MPRKVVRPRTWKPAHSGTRLAMRCSNLSWTIGVHSSARGTAQHFSGWRTRLARVRAASNGGRRSGRIEIEGREIPTSSAVAPHSGYKPGHHLNGLGHIALAEGLETWASR
eukprot:4714538-Pyramimonas_sp.AAC.1